MHILYMIFIYPLEFLMKTILEFSHSLTDNYGLSIITLSIIVNIILLPLYYMAEKWKAKDKAIQDSMKSEIDNIKKHYKGQERHFYIQTIYRRHKYHPLSSIKASIGFLIQIPFFFAAFHLLSNYQALNGVSFGILKDLGNPDHLISGINILPIVMTIVNLLSAYIYIELLNKSEKIQLFALAFIFLVVLYNEPAGLLLYWTMNNVFSLMKNIIEKKFKLGSLFSRTFKGREEEKTFINANHFTALYKKLSVPIWFFLLVLAIGLDRIYNFQLHKTNASYAFESIIIFIYLNGLIILRYFSGIGKKNKLFISLISLLSLAIMALVVDYVLQILTFTSSVYLKDNIIILLSVLILLLFIRELLLYKKIKVIDDFIPTLRLFFATYFSIFLLLFLINPMILFLSASEDFLISLDDIIYRGLILLLISIVSLTSVYYFSSKIFKTLLTILGIIILLLFVSYSFVIVKDYGLMDHFIFNKPINLIISQQGKTIEFFLLYIAIIFFIYIILHYKEIIEKFIFAIFLMLSSFFLLNVTKQTNEINAETSYSHKIKTAYDHEIKTTLSLSKEKNILVFFLDGFSGGDLERIFREKKDILSEYDGFVRYKNVLTVNNGTWGSVLSMFGGWKYTVEEINKRPNETLREKAKNAYSVFEKAFTPNNWALTYLYPQYAYDINKSTNNPHFGYGEYYLKKYQKNTDKKEFKRNNLKMLLKISWFKVVPLSIKNTIYDNGMWGNDNNANAKLKAAIQYKSKYWGFLNSFQNDMEFNSSQKTLKYFQLGIPHGPHSIDENGTLSNKSSYYTECYVTLKKLGTIFRKMKKNNVYDNTKIIIVSDHGWWRENINFHNNFEKIIPKGYGDRMNIGMINPILLVKDFNRIGPIRTSNKFMTNADVPAIVCSSLETGCPIEDTDPTTHDLNRTLIVSTVRSTILKRGNVFEVYSQYKVKNNIFNPKNWTKLKEEK